MGKERFKPAKDCATKLHCYSLNGCFKSWVLEEYLRETVPPKGLAEGVYQFWRDSSCGHPDAKRIELKIKLAGNQDMVHPSRRAK